MKKLTVPTLNVLLAVGFMFILAGFFLLVYRFADAELLRPVMQGGIIFLGALLLYVSLTVYKRAILFFAGLYLFLVASLYLLISSSIVSATWDGLWPCSVILCGVCLLVTCLFRHRRILSAYLFPSVLLLVLGGLFLLFSLDIVAVSFRTFVSRWWPFMLILAGGVLVGLFLYQQTPGNHFPYEPESDALEDGDDGE